MVLPLSKGENVLDFGCLSVVEGCSLSPEWAQLEDNGGAHGTSPVKPIVAGLHSQAVRDRALERKGYRWQGRIQDFGKGGGGGVPRNC